ncbi:hypothetical protein BY996DRAFT_4572610, partial [Phakopsora pachyrhizi]
ITEKISKMPSHLQVFISNSLELNQRKITKDMITEIIKYFHSQWKPPPRKTKAILISCFEDLVKPLIVNYQTSSAPQNIAKAKPIITDQPQIDLSSLNPNDTRFTTDHIISILQARVPQIKLCKQMNKKLAIFYCKKYIQPQPKKGYPENFTTRPKKVPYPYHSILSLDEMWYHLQHLVLEIFIPSGVKKPAIKAIYENFILDINPIVQIEEKLDYFIFNQSS